MPFRSLELLNAIESKRKRDAQTPSWLLLEDSQIKKKNEQESWHWEQSVSCLSWCVFIMTWRVNGLCSRSFIHDNENLSLNQFLFDFHQQSKRTSHSRKKLSITHILFYHRCHTLVTCHVKECHIIWVTCSLGVSSCQSKEWITFANDSAI